MEKRLKTNPAQWAAFLDFVEINPQILTKKFDGVNGRKKYNKLWEEIAKILNSMGYLKKTVDKWQKVSYLLLHSYIRIILFTIHVLTYEFPKFGN